MKNLMISLALWSTLYVACNDPEPAKDATADAATAPEWKVGVQLWTFHNFDFMTAIAKADSAGAKFLEAYPGQKIGGDFKDAPFDHTLSAEGRTKIKELLTSKGMTIVAFGVIVPQTREEWEKTVAFAKDMGIQFLTAEPKKEHWALADSLAGVNGIKIAIHDHPKPSPYWHPDSVLAAAAGHPNIGACADIGHWGRNGLDPVECLKKLEGHIFTSHLKDIKEMNVIESGDMIVGTGVFNMPAILAEMKRQQFKGIFSIEREDNWDNNVPDVIQTFRYMEEQTKKLQ